MRLLRPNAGHARDLSARSNWVVYVGVVVPILAGYYIGRSNLRLQNWTVFLFPLGLLLLASIQGDPFKLLLIWIVLGFPLQSWGGVNLGMGLPSVNVERFFLGSSLLVVLAQVVLNRRRLIRPTFVDFLLVAFLVMASLSVLLNAMDLRTDVMEIWWQVVPLTVFFLTRNLVRSETEIWRIATVLRWSILVIALWSLVEQATGISLMTGQEIARIGQYDEIIRSSSGLGHPSATGTALAMALPFVLLSLLREQGQMSKALTLAQVGLMGVAVYFTYIRAAWIAFALVFIVMGLFIPRLRWLSVSTSVIAILIAVVSWTSIIQNSVFEYKVANPQNLYERLDVGQIQWELFLDNPVLGYGGSAPVLLERLSGTSSHNTFLGHLTLFGLLGFVPYVLPVLLALRSGWNAYRRMPDARFEGRPLVLAFWCAAMAYSINAMSVELRWYGILAGLFWMALAILLTMGDLVQHPESSCESCQQDDSAICVQPSGAHP